MSLAFRAASILGLVLAVLLAAWFGLFSPADQALLDARFRAADRAPSGEIVFIEIDAQSLDGVGVWPWPRSIHASLLDKLIEAGARDVVFDVDFSSASSEAEDAKLEAALERAGGYAFLAAFRQFSGGEIVWSYPLARFAEHASPVLVNVETDAAGRLSSVPAALRLENETIPSIALALAPSGTQSDTIGIDFSIDLTQVQRISAIDVLRDEVEPELLFDKQVVIGASAIALRDLFTVSRFGIIPGPLAQIAAVETVKASRALTALETVPAAIFAALLALVALWRGSSWSPRRQAIIVLGIALAVEAVALLAFQAWAATFDTMPIHAVAAGLVGIAFLDERAARFRQHQRVKAQRALVQQMLSQVITDSFDGIVVVDERGIIIAASDAAGAVIGVEGRLESRLMDDIFPPALLRCLEQASEGAQECVCSIGGVQRILEVVATRSKVPDSEISGREREVLCVTFQDVTEKRQQAERLAYLARHDTVTGALSRYAFQEHVTSQLTDSSDTTLVLVRMDRLRSVSATLGHDVSDAVLCAVHERLAARIGSPVARLGSDLFAFCRPRLLGAPGLQHELTGLAQQLEDPYDLGDHTVVLGARFGVSSTLTAKRDASELLQQAEIALGASSSTDAAAFSVYAPSDGESMRARQRMDVAMRRALRNGEFFLVYQPQIDLETGVMIGVEALVRWKDPAFGIVSPADFIPLAEETGFVVPLGDWVLRQACQEAAGWAWAGRLSVNVSAVQFKLADVVALVEEACRDSGFPVHRLDLEITESLYVGNEGAIIEALQRLRDMGARIAIDDFGTGYSSLSYLSRLPADKIKVDQSFVRSLPEPGSQTIVETIVTMAGRLGLSIIAEGVETTEQRDYLHELGCQVGQGYLFGRPASAGELGLKALPIAS